MPEIFLIHDQRRKDRSVLFRKEFEEQGIEQFHLMPAVTDLGSPTKNISNAHKNCIKKAIAMNLDRVVIMEDDVKFACPSAYNRFLELSEMLPANWEVFTTGSYGYKIASGTGPIVKMTWLSGLQCYMVSSRYYQKLLGAQENKNIDRCVIGEVYMSYPMLAVQHDTFSDNVKRVTNYNFTHVKKVHLWNCKSI